MVNMNVPAHVQLMLTGDTSLMHIFYASIKSVDNISDEPSWCELSSDDGETLLIDTRGDTNSVTRMPSSPVTRGTVLMRFTQEGASILVRSLKRYRMLDARIR